jgi:glycosyltransferase involved in cell wall biosynthesis
MKVSVVTCTYNSEKYLEECLDSVAGQTYQDIEHIIVDGQSSDRTLDIIGKNENLVVHKRAPNGISDAMNHGISLASGDLIACLHSDDYFYDSNVVETVVKQFERTNKRWSYGGHNALLSETESRLHNVVAYSLPRFYWQNFIHHPTVFAHRSLFEECGDFDTSYKYAMDVDLWHRFLNVATPLPIDSIITCFRRYGESLSMKDEKKAMAEALGIYWKYSRGQRYLFLLSLGYFLKKHLYLVLKR